MKGSAAVTRIIAKLSSHKKIIYVLEAVLLLFLIILSIGMADGNFLSGRIGISYIVVSRKIVYLLPFLFVFDLFILHNEFTVKHKKEIFIIVLTIFFSSLPLFIKGLKYGDDLIFHLNRIEGICLGLKSGIFPVKIQPNWFDGAGYAAGVMYGDILLYIPALLRLAGFEVYSSYKIFLFLINVFTVLCASYSFKHIFKNGDLGLLSAFVYSMTPYRFINMYRRAALGETIGMSVLPLIALAVYMIYSTECKDKKNRREIVTWLTVGMCVMLQSHILSTEMTFITMLIICIVFWKKTFSKNVILTYIKAAALTVLLSLYFLVPFIDYMKNSDMWLNEQLRIGVFRNIENNALEIGRFFTFFYTNFTDYDTGHDFNPGIVLMGAFIISVFMYITGKLNKRAKLYFWFSFGFLILSSDIFPWRLWGKTPFGYIMTSVQSPWRFITLACVFLVLLFGELYQIITEAYSGEKIASNAIGMILTSVSVMLLVITSSVFTSAYDEYDHNASYREAGELDSFFAGGMEYVPLAAIEQIPVSFEATEGTEITGYSRTLNHFTVSAVSDGDGFIDLPLLNYKGYVAKDSATGSSFEIISGPYACVRICVPAGYNGTLSVDFIEPLYWRISEIISLLSLIMVLTSGIITKNSLKGCKNVTETV